MLRLARRLALDTLTGALLGTLLLGLAGRTVMRLLAHVIDRAPVFSVGGTVEVMAYGTIVGSVSGAGFTVVRLLPLRWQARGILLAALSYAGTIATLPAHIADTARPFAERMPVVYALFGLCFLSFGLALAWTSCLWSSPGPAAAPDAPRE